MWTAAAGLGGKVEVHPSGKARDAATKEPVYHRTTEKGYLTFRRTVGGRARDFRLHRVIAETFIPNPDQLPEVNHRDFDKANCAVDNLEWCTRAYNHAHALDGGRMECNTTASRPLIAYHPLLGTEERFLSVREACRAGHDGKTLREAIKRGWKHHGRYWRYEDPAKISEPPCNSDTGDPY